MFDYKVTDIFWAWISYVIETLIWLEVYDTYHSWTIDSIAFKVYWDTKIKLEM